MGDADKNIFAKLLAGVFGVTLFFVVAALGSGTHDECKLAADPQLCGAQGYSLDGHTIVFGLGCAIVSAAALWGAITIRRRLGGPLIGPWKHW